MREVKERRYNSKPNQTSFQKGHKKIGGFVVGSKHSDESKELISQKRYEWANVSGQYLRELSDYIQLCPSCHRKLDLGKITL